MVSSIHRAVVIRTSSSVASSRLTGLRAQWSNQMVNGTFPSATCKREPHATSHLSMRATPLASSIVFQETSFGTRNFYL